MRRNDPCACGSGKRFKSCCGRLPAGPPGREAAGPPGREAPGEGARGTVSSSELEALAALWKAGHFGELEQRARSLLASAPTAGALWQLLGAALGAQGKDAIPALEAAVRASPEDPAAHLNLGNALGRRGRLEAAAASYERALHLRPEFPEARNNAADVQLELGRFEEAAESCRRAIRLKPDYLEAHLNLGKALLRLGDARGAADSCRRAIEIRPDHAGARNSLGAALLNLSRFNDAVAEFRHACSLARDFAEAHANLGNALRSIGQLQEAAAEYRRALAIKPDFLRAFTELGTTLRLQRLTSEAEAACREALKIDPGSAATLAVLAEVRADAGRFVEAEDLFRQALAIDAGCVEALSGLTHVRRMTAADAAWLAAAKRLAGSPLTPPRKILLHHSIGKYFDDVGDYDEAFANFRFANELAKSCGPGHDRTVPTRMVDFIIRCHTREWLSARRDLGNSSLRPVFIVGMLRSGTTLAEQILAAHPDVLGAGELPFWSGRLAAAAARACAAEAPESHQGEADDSAGAAYLDLLRRVAAGAARVVDKMPTNFFALGLIHAAFPRTRIIHMRRNPIDTCLSIYFQHFEAANTYSNDLDDLAHYCREYLRLMQHWRAVLPADVLLEVDYEGLAADPAAWTRRMLDFLDLPWDPRCLEFHRAATTVVTASRWQVRQPVHTQHVQRWRNYEKHVQALLPLMKSGFA